MVKISWESCVHVSSQRCTYHTLFINNVGESSQLRWFGHLIRMLPTPPCSPALGMSIWDHISRLSWEHVKILQEVPVVVAEELWLLWGCCHHEPVVDEQTGNTWLGAVWCCPSIKPLTTTLLTLGVTRWKDPHSCQSHDSPKNPSTVASLHSYISQSALNR